MTSSTLWDRFKNTTYHHPKLEFSLDYSRMNLPNSFVDLLSPGFDKAYAEMVALEQGAIANIDEKRMVGHYWLRNPSIAPQGLGEKVVETLQDIKDFAAKVHSGAISNSNGERFQNALVIGIGGSALGPQFVDRALGRSTDPLKLYFLDNTDPDGMVRLVSEIRNLDKTLVVVISKSGGTKETRNGQLFLKNEFSVRGLPLSKHFVAVTGEGSELEKTAKAEGWLCSFPMWDWVGGRTSELSAVGLLPAALQGRKIDDLIEGARAMDEATREQDLSRNPAGLLAALWFYATGGRGEKAMVVLPYKDRLELLSKYLQQLIMESLGKELDRSGNTVNQGISVYGNKGSTDQHAYVQQLRDGPRNFFATFVECLSDGGSQQATQFEVDPGVTCGDYLCGFLYGTRRALYESDRESITLTVKEVSEFSIGLVIALFERAVGFYASLVNVNAYHQPGVEAGKIAATSFIELQKKVVAKLSAEPTVAKTAEKWAQTIGPEADPEDVFHILRHLAANGRALSHHNNNWLLTEFSLR